MDGKQGSVSTVERCGAVAGGVAAGDRVTPCDREPGHAGSHRGYRPEQDEVVFWTEPLSLPTVIRTALTDTRRRALEEARARIEARLTALAGEQIQGRDWVLIAMGRALLVVDELLEGD